MQFELRTIKLVTMRTAESLGPTAQKILVLLLGGFALGLSHSPTQHFRIISTIRKDIAKINRRALHNAIRALYRSKLIDAEDNPNGSTTIVLTEKGKRKALTYDIENMRIQPMKKWDKKWRVVLFDIPEKRRKMREALVRALKVMEFYQFQKSVFVHPFECKNEIDFVIEFFLIRPHVRLITADHIDNELHLKNLFNLN